MNYLDIAIAIIVLYGLIKGFYNGFVNEVFGIIALVGGLFVALTCSQFADPYLHQWFSDSAKYSSILSFVILFLTTYLLLKLFGTITHKVIKLIALGWINRIFGGIFGMLKLVLVISYLLDIEENFSLISLKAKEQSELYIPTKKSLTYLTPFFAEGNNWWNETKENLNS